uniref:Fe2OG dioxygenase domain-containing protein n=1 Tax=Leersia perrieri TaxID=77586 RepID=A0A0D9VVT4_9ORYZ
MKPNICIDSDALDRYSVETTNLEMRILRFMAADLGIEQGLLLGAFRGERQSASIHQYPPCRHADKVIGITPHTDGLALTILLQVDDTPGLQISRDDGGGRTWFPVRPRPGTFVVNVGDMLEVLTNGMYRSVEHRVVITDAEKCRTTIGMFHEACVDGMVRSIPELLGGAEARYKSTNRIEFARSLKIWIILNLGIRPSGPKFTLPGAGA